MIYDERKCKAYYEDGEMWEGSWSKSLHFWSDSKVLHRVDGPAVEFENGDLIYCLNGKLHRVDGPAVDTFILGKEWFINGERHRLDGPALVGKGYREWWVNDRLHREDGMAVEVDVHSGWHNQFHINGVMGDKKIIKKILNYKRKSSLAEHLLDNNECVRFFASKRLKELGND